MRLFASRNDSLAATGFFRVGNVFVSVLLSLVPGPRRKKGGTSS